MKFKMIYRLSIALVLTLTTVLSAARSRGNSATYSQATVPVMKDVQDRTALPSKGVSRVEVKQFVFELKECKKLGDRITCELLITNNDKDQWLQVQSSQYDNPTRMIDTKGNENIVAGIQFGAKKGDIRTTLVTGVPVKATILFEPVSTDVDKLSLLEIYCSREIEYVVESFSAQFRDVPLTIAPTKNQDDTDKSKSIVTKAFAFNFISCSNSAKGVLCSFSVKNEDSESKSLALHVNCGGQRTYVIDDGGNEYRPIDGNLGKAFISRSAGGGNLGCFAEQQLAPGVVTNGALRFEGINPSVILLKLMRIKFSTDHSISFDVDFRDLPIVK